MLRQKQKINELIDELEQSHHLSRESWKVLLEARLDEDVREELAMRAREQAIAVFGKKVFIRGLIEFTNICQNDCFYCGIRRGNTEMKRYRLMSDEILACCEEGYRLGFRTFVLQGGEDPYWTDERLIPLVEIISKTYPDCALTLSMGERTEESYRALFHAGARRYLLRHETANAEYYHHLHPQDMSMINRLNCLRQLRDIGFQTGCGLMVGSPGQTTEHLIEDFLFMQAFQPHMVGIGPFLPHHATPFKDERAGSVVETLALLSLIRLMFPEVLLPATTALGSAQKGGRENGILAGANVIMPNLSPQRVREHYMLYDGKLSTGSEAAESLRKIKEDMSAIGYEVVVSRGDHPSKTD